MIASFSPSQGLIQILVDIEGPAGRETARMALDTGALKTIVSEAVLIQIGYQPATGQAVQIRSASGFATASRLPVFRIEALGVVRHNFEIVCHTLPANCSVDGLLGLDFLRGLELRIDFRNGVIELQ